MHQARGRVLTAEKARLSRQPRHHTPPPSIFSQKRHGEKPSRHTQPHKNRKPHTTQNHPQTHEAHPKTSTHVDKNQAKTLTKQPPDKHEHPAHHKDARETRRGIQFTRCSAATLRSQHPTNRLRHHANTATSRRSRHATEYAQQHRAHRATVSARHARRH